MNSKKLTYNQALEEINQIISEIENGNIDIDNISEKLTKAKTLFEFCQSKLKETQSKVENLLDDNNN